MELHYHPLSPPARAAFVLLKHLNLPFTDKRPNLLTGELKTPEYLKLNPSHTVPILVDDGFALFESRAILAYVADKVGTDLYPRELHQRAKVDCVLFYDASALWPAVLECRIARYFHGDELTAKQMETFKEKLEILEKMMDGRKHLAGDHLTIADISVASNVGIFLSESWVPAAIKQWYGRVRAEVPALKKMLDAEPDGLEALGEVIAARELARERSKKVAKKCSGN